MLVHDYQTERPVQPRTGQHNNLPGALAQKPRWEEPTMKAAKLFAWLYANIRAGSEDRLLNFSDWATVGVTGPALLAEVRRLLPHFDEVWQEQGREFDEGRMATALHNRVWYMYRQRRKGEKHPTQCLSCEHPQNSRRLAPYRDEAKRLYGRGRPLSRTETNVAFGPKGT